ncbi:MAG: alpha/beta hydrolase [Deltaproteobacteria bacterium]|nr:alpha/beta hydrolase [Deltaproteobacteria bacterium]
MTPSPAAPWLFLFVSLVGAAFTATAVLRIRRISYLIVPYFFGAWLTGELAVHHVAWQAIATVVFVALGALDAWPGWLGLAITVTSWAALAIFHQLAGVTGAVFDAALDHDLAEADGPTSAGVPFRRIARPFKFPVRGVERIRNVAYGPHGRRNQLDVYLPLAADGAGPFPILFQIHGGGWTIGQKDQQALPLLYHLAARGWLCVAANYRLSPRATFPDHLVDVKRALAWTKRHAAEYGGDPSFVVVTGGSAGGHLAALVALTANDPEYQPGFEDADTTVQGCVPFYGVYDFLDRYGERGRASMTSFLGRLVMKSSPETDRDAWEKASPIARVHADAPPFFVIHGTHDSLAYVEDARHFVRALRGVSRHPVVYAELPGAQHAFDIFHSRRSAYAVDAVTRFVERLRVEELARRASGAVPRDAAAPGRTPTRAAAGRA